ncbi:MAG: NAD(P)-binding domain-containing protein, partial [Chloroflexota bacterium]
MDRTALPVVVIGGGPVGLAAAAELVERGVAPLILEAGSSVGASILRWGHVRLFSPWRYDIAPGARRLLERSGWNAPDGDGYPTGREVVDGYLRPLAALPEIAVHLRLAHRVTAVTRLGLDKMRTSGRDEAPFAVSVRTPMGERTFLARAVIDASGTYTAPNPLGASGTFARGEMQAAERIHYGIPDVRERDRARYAGKRVAVVGSGHSAFDVLIDLATLAPDGTTI